MCRTSNTASSWEGRGCGGRGCSIGRKVHDNMRAGAAFDRATVLMNILAAVIASYGLLANSPPW